MMGPSSQMMAFGFACESSYDEKNIASRLLIKKQLLTKSLRRCTSIHHRSLHVTSLIKKFTWS